MYSNKTIRSFIQLKVSMRYPIFVHVIWGMRKTDCNHKKSENRKSKSRKLKKIGKEAEKRKNGKIEIFQNLAQTMVLTSARRASRSP